MVTCVVAIPFLFWHRYKNLTTFCCAYTLFFIVTNRLSQWFLGECVLTTLARQTSASPDNDWFVVRFSKWVFGVTVTAKQVAGAETLLVALVCLGVLTVIMKNAAERNV